MIIKATFRFYDYNMKVNRLKLSLIIIAIISFLSPTFAEEQEVIKGRFFNVAGKALRTPTDFKLAKVEKYNLKAIQIRKPVIKYQAYWLDLPENQRALDIEFLELSPEMFLELKALYGNVSPVKPKEGMHNYPLNSIMPPMVQALDGHVFRNGKTKVKEINEGLIGAEGKAIQFSLDTEVRTDINCFTTTYNLLGPMGFSFTGTTNSSLTIFYTGHLQAYDFFSQLGQSVGKFSFAIGDKVKINEEAGLQTGDFLMILGDTQLFTDIELSARGEIIDATPSSVVRFLEHTAIFIDENLIFEKSNAGDHDPFRFYPLDLAAKPYSDDKATTVEVRRFHGHWTHPIEVFGGTKYAVSEEWKRELPPDLRKLITMSKLLLYPHDGVFYNTWSSVNDVPLIMDPQSGSTRLSAMAYKGLDPIDKVLSCRRAMARAVTQ